MAVDKVVFKNVLIAHAVLGCLAWALFMPLGAMAIRLLKRKGTLWLHAGWMMFAYIMALASMGMGIWIGVSINKINSAHAIIGLVVVGSAILQPLTGLLHHARYKAKGRPNAFTFPHVWWGRAIVTLGIIDGGLGIKLVNDGPYGDRSTRIGAIAYGVVAGVIWVAWMAVIAVSFFNSRGKAEGETGEKFFGPSDSSDNTQNGDINSPSQFASPRPSESHRPSDAALQIPVTRNSIV